MSNVKVDRDLSCPGAVGAQRMQGQVPGTEPPLWLLCYACSVPAFSWHWLVSPAGNLGALPVAQGRKKKNLGIVFLPVGSPGALAERKELLRFSVSEENEPSENNVILMFLCLLPSIPMRVCANIPATEQK